MEYGFGGDGGINMFGLYPLDKGRFERGCLEEEVLPLCMRGQKLNLSFLCFFIYFLSSFLLPFFSISRNI